MVKFQEIIMWILIILSTVMVFWYIFGDSPTFEQMILGIILTLSITTLVKVSVLENRLRNLGRSFYALANDFKAHLKQKNNYEKVSL